jgi:hypothetical protein
VGAAPALRPHSPSLSLSTRLGSCRGKIAFVDRGLCRFTDKARFVQTVGAIAMVVNFGLEARAMDGEGDMSDIVIPWCGATARDASASAQQCMSACAVQYDSVERVGYSARPSHSDEHRHVAGGLPCRP